MRQASASIDRPSLAAVDRYLLPKEVQVATVRRHPVVLIVPGAAAVLGLLGATALSATVVHGSVAALYAIWIAELILVLWLIWRAMNWAVDYFVITSARLLRTSGFFARSVTFTPLNKITDLNFERSFAGRLFGYGEFEVESASQNQRMKNIDHIPYPEQLYLLLCGMLFPEDADEGPLEEDVEGDIPFGEDDSLLTEQNDSMLELEDTTRFRRPWRRGIRRSRRDPGDEL